MFERRDVLKASVGEGDIEVALSWCVPAKGAAETVEVVVVGEAAQRAFRLGQAGEPVAVKDLALEYFPEGLDLAIGPGGGDLRTKVPDVEVAQSLPKPGENARHPGHEWGAVVAHKLQRLAAKLEAVFDPA